MKSIITIALALIIPIGSALAQISEKQTLTIPLSKPGERGRLLIDLVNGSIKVTGYTGSEVLITAMPADEAMHKINSECEGCPKHKDKDRSADRDDDRSSGMKRISSNPIELEATENNNVVDIESNSWKRGITLEVKVPANFDLKLSTVNRGDITVTGVNGAIDVANVNGAITLTNIAGSVLGNTVNGDIKADFNKVNNNEPMAFTTLNGDIDVSFPTGIKATTKMKSERGEIFSDFDMKVRQSEPKSSRDGREFKIEINAWVYGDINGGGPEYKMQNMNGNIYIREQK
ncbi:MAG: DUF4097 family beta strand repeat-containing protein [Cyclobacteriaceae bacterium]